MHTHSCPTRLALLICLLSAGCGAGRTAAWEQQPAPALEASKQEAPDELALQLQQAEAHWAKRDQRSEVLTAIDLWKKVVDRDPRNAVALTRLSRAYYFFVDGFLNIENPEDLGDKKLKYHLSGADFGERALMVLDPQFEETMRNDGDFIEAIGKINKPAIEAAYWYCTNLGRFAVAKGLSAKLFYKDRVAGAMQRIAEVAPDFFYAAGDRYLGAFYAALPGIAGKDLDKSAVHFDKALKASPEYLGNLVVKAEFLAVETDDQALYESLLNQTLKGEDGTDPNLAPENRAAKRTAQKLLTEEEIDDRF